MSKAQKRIEEGKQARLKQELNFRMHQVPIKYHCPYLRPDHVNQYKRGWDSVTELDIRSALLVPAQAPSAVSFRSKK